MSTHVHDGEWCAPCVEHGAALASATDEGPSHLTERYDHDRTFRHHHDSVTRAPIWWEHADEFGGEKREHRHAASAPDEGPRSYVKGHWDGLHCDAKGFGGTLSECDHVGRIYEARPAAPVAPLPGQEVGHGCSPECNACRADRLAASAPDEGPNVSAAALRLALRTEMGWSVHEVEEFLGQYHLTKPLDEYDPQRLDGEYAALAASATDGGPREPTWSPTDPSTVEFPVDDGRPAASAPDEERVGEFYGTGPAAPAALDGLIGAALDEWNQQATGAQGWPAMAALEAAYSARPAAPATLDEGEP